MFKIKKRFQGLDCSSDFPQPHTQCCLHSQDLLVNSPRLIKATVYFFFHQFLPIQSVTYVRGAVCYCVCYDCHFVVCPPVRLQTTCHRGIDHSRRGMCVHACTCVCVFAFALTTLSLATINSERRFQLPGEPKANEPSRMKILSLTMLTCTAESSTLQNSVLPSNQIPAIVPVSMQLKKSNY